MKAYLVGGGSIAAAAGLTFAADFARAAEYYVGTAGLVVAGFLKVAE